MSNNITCLYLGVVHDWRDSQVKVSVEKSFHTGCDVSTNTGLGVGERKEKGGEQLRPLSKHKQVIAFRGVKKYLHTSRWRERITEVADTDIYL